MSSGDFNEDSILDLVVTNWDSTINILFGNAAGSFQNQVNYPTGINATNQENNSIIVSLDDGGGSSKTQRAVILFRDVAHSGISSAPGISSYSIPEFRSPSTNSTYSRTIEFHAIPSDSVQFRNSV
jgi:hypothetical protein